MLLSKAADLTAQQCWMPAQRYGLVTVNMSSHTVMCTDVHGYSTVCTGCNLLHSHEKAVAGLLDEDLQSKMYVGTTKKRLHLSAFM